MQLEISKMYKYDLDLIIEFSHKCEIDSSVRACPAQREAVLW
jgi:hypothetical protein